MARSTDPHPSPWITRSGRKHEHVRCTGSWPIQARKEKNPVAAILIGQKMTTRFPLFTFRCHVFHCFQSAGGRIFWTPKKRFETCFTTPRSCVICWALRGFFHSLGRMRNGARCSKRMVILCNSGMTSWLRLRTDAAAVGCPRVKCTRGVPLVMIPVHQLQHFLQRPATRCNRPTNWSGDNQGNPSLRAS